MKHWITIRPEVYMLIQEYQYILINTCTGQYIQGEDEQIASLLKKIKNNGYKFGVNENDFTIYRDFLLKMKSLYMADYITEENARWAVQSYPINILEKKISDLGKMDEDIMSFLHEVNIYLDLGCQQHCKRCQTDFKQSLCCTKLANPLKTDDLIKFFISSHILPSTKINIIVCGSHNHADFHKFYSTICQYHKIESIYIHSSNISIDSSLLDCNYKIIVTSPEMFKPTYNNSDRVEYICLATDISAVDSYETTADQCNISNYTILPIYTGSNIGFFKKYVFINIDKLFERKLNIKYLMRNEIVNSQLFGTFNIFSDGTIYASVNDKPIGHIIKDKLRDLVHKEISIGTSWLKTRKHHQICKKCRYISVCPSISDIELFMSHRICNKGNE